MGQICQLYASADELHAKGVNLISCDEKTGIQALQREVIPLTNKQVERQSHEYIRHGTACLIANFQVATGLVLAPSVGESRTEADFIAHIAKTVGNDPQAEWIFIVDNLNTHKSAGLVTLVAKTLQLNTPLGEKGKSGILHSMESRAKFLSDERHRIRFVYLPKRTSWLNQVELWFSILVRRLLKRLSVCSKAELMQKIHDFIQYFNVTMAKPFKWTYQGRPLTL